MLAALDYAHEQHVVHRDIKPENILLQRGQAFVADFGIAVALSVAGGARLTETGLSMGTPHYMSPEQATADQTLDGRTDVYSLACVIYEMLAGEPPFTGSSAQAVIAKILSETPSRLRTFRETLPDHVERAVRKGMSRNRAERFPTAGELARALSDPRLTLDGKGSVAIPAGMMMMLRRLGIALLVAALVVGVVSARWLGRETAAVPSVARLRERLPQSQRVVGGEVFSPSISPDGSQVAYNGGAAGGERIYVRRLDDLDAQLIPGTEDAIRSFFSADGRWLCFVSRGKLMKVALPGGSPQVITDVHDEIYGADWGSDDVIVFGEGGRVMRVSADGGVAELAAAPDTTAGMLGLRWPSVLPGSRNVVVTAWYGSPETARLAVASVASGTVKLLPLSGLRPQYAATGHLVYARADGQVMAVPFDLTRLEAKGEPAEVIGEVDGAGLWGPQFALSESGSVVYVPAPAVTPSADLVLVDRSGAAVPLQNLDGRPFAEPRFSPHGDRISVTSTGGVWLYDVDRSTLSRRTGGAYAAWLPDGRRLSFSEPDRDGHRSLFTIAADGSDDPSLLYRGAHRVWESDWSPDGRWLAFREGGIGETSTLRDVFVLRMDSVLGPPTPLLQSEFNESMIAISPDGNWLAYVSDETGMREVYVRPFPTGEGRVQLSIDGGVEPSWAPGGGELFYRTPTAMAVARYQAGPPFRVIGGQILFQDPYLRRDNIADYDVDPRSGRLLMVRGNNEAGEGGLVIILNWFQELKRQVPNG